MDRSLLESRPSTRLLESVLFVVAVALCGLATFAAYYYAQ
jgi:hypothetical protein